MHPSTRPRNETLDRIQHLLKTPDGEVLMEELRDTWDPIGLLGDSPQQTGYNCGLRDAFKFMESLQNGELKHE